MSQILAGREKFFWLELARVGVWSAGSELFWYKCLGPLNAFVKDETTREISILEFINQRILLCVKKGMWVVSRLDLSIGQ